MSNQECVENLDKAVSLIAKVVQAGDPTSITDLKGFCRFLIVDRDDARHELINVEKKLAGAREEFKTLKKLFSDYDVDCKKMISTIKLRYNSYLAFFMCLAASVTGGTVWIILSVK